MAQPSTTYRKGVAYAHDVAALVASLALPVVIEVGQPGSIGGSRVGLDGTSEHESDQWRMVRFFDGAENL